MHTIYWSLEPGRSEYLVPLSIYLAGRHVYKIFNPYSSGGCAVVQRRPVICSGPVVKASLVCIDIRTALNTRLDLQTPWGLCSCDCCKIHGLDSKQIDLHQDI